MAEPLVLKRCPICGKPNVQKFEPFCSKRCADLDLSRWLKGVYAIPAAQGDDEDDDAAVPDGSPKDE